MKSEQSYEESYAYNSGIKQLFYFKVVILDMIFRQRQIATFNPIILAVLILSACIPLNATPDPAKLLTLPKEYDCVRPEQEPQIARVISVTDGDTIVVELDGHEYRVRYIGINAPELNSDEHLFAEMAKQENIDLVKGQLVALYRDTSETDRFDRLLRYVFSGEVFVNYSLVEKGVAWQRDYPPDSSCKDLLEQAQKSAQRAQLGIWKKQ